MKIDDLYKFLQDTLRINIEVLDKEPMFITSLPLALKKRYPVTRIKIYDQKAYIVQIEDASRGSVSKHYELVNDATEYPVILYISKQAKELKNYLIERNIPFVIEESVIYLPQFAMYAAELETDRFKLKTRRKKLSKFSQQTLLYLLLTQRQRSLNISELADIYNVSDMTASRALTGLYDEKILTVELEGRVKEYRLTDEKKSLEKILLLLKAPKNGAVYIAEDDESYFQHLKLSGSSALSNYTDMIEGFRTYAIEKKNLNKLLDNSPHIEVYSEAYDNSFIKIETWTYSPSILPENDNNMLIDNYTNRYVDAISLYLNYQKTVQEHSDIRLSNAMNQLYIQVKEIIYG